MAMIKIEALALAIARGHNAWEVCSEAFELLNPGLLKSHDNKIRAFGSYTAGHQALVDNLKAKCTGRVPINGNALRLGPSSSLRELCESFRYIKARSVIEFLQDALSDRAITETTPLQFFIEGQDGN